MRRTKLLILSAAALTWSNMANAALYEVRMLTQGPHQMFEFEPNLLRIQPGDTVHFIAKSRGHNVQTVPGMIPDGARPFRSATSEDLTVTFAQAGVYGIECNPHAELGMVGLIMVGNSWPNLEQAKTAPPPSVKAKQVFARLFQEAQTHTAGGG